MLRGGREGRKGWRGVVYAVDLMDGPVRERME